VDNTGQELICFVVIIEPFVVTRLVVDPKESFADGYGVEEAFVNAKTNFTIHAIDKKGNPVIEEKSPFTVESDPPNEFQVRDTLYEKKTSIPYHFTRRSYHFTQVLLVDSEIQGVAKVRQQV
jgi:hypothetical protein